MADFTSEEGEKHSLLEMSVNNVVEVRRAEVPTYLQSGEFYGSLSDQEEGYETIKIPSNTLKADTNVSNEQELVHLLSSLRFWGVNDIPDELIAFCLSGGHSMRCKSAMLLFAADLPYIHTLIQITDPHRAVSSKIKDVVKAGNIAILDYLLRNGHDLETAGASAVQANQADVLRYLQDKSQPLSEWLFLVAFTSGSFDCVKYFHESGWPWPREPCGLAMAAGRLEILQYVHEHGAVWESADVGFNTNYVKAVSSGHLECVKYANEHGCPSCSTAMKAAARVGNIEILKYFHSLGQVGNADVSAVAAEMGHLECLRFLHEVGCPWDVNTTRIAAAKGTLACLQYAHEHGCPWDHTVTSAAARVPGKLDKLAYLIEQGCPMTSAACANAATNDNLAALTYLHEHNCPWDENTCISAARCDALQCLIYAVRHGCPRGTAMEDMARVTAEAKARNDNNKRNKRKGCWLDSFLS